MLAVPEVQPVVEAVTVTDTIPLAPEVTASDLDVRVVSVAELLGPAIERIHSNRSVSALFDVGEDATLEID